MSEKKFSCYYCGGETTSQKEDVDFRWGEELFVVRDVPVLVCKQCGEKYYSAKVSAKLDRIATKRQEAKSLFECQFSSGTVLRSFFAIFKKTRFC